MKIAYDGVQSSQIVFDESEQLSEVMALHRARQRQQLLDDAAFVPNYWITFRARLLSKPSLPAISAGAAVYGQKFALS